MPDLSELWPIGLTAHLSDQTACVQCMSTPASSLLELVKYRQTTGRLSYKKPAYFCIMFLFNQINKYTMC